jgi:hypothetical protein
MRETHAMVARTFAVALTALLMIAMLAPVDAQSAGVSISLGAPRNDAARCVNPTRITMYGAQIADALTAGAVDAHGGISRTPFGGSPATLYLVEQGVLDAIVGALTRRANCAQKNIIDGAIGASALSNALQNGAPK